MPGYTSLRSHRVLVSLSPCGEWRATPFDLGTIGAVRAGTRGEVGVLVRDQMPGVSVAQEGLLQAEPPCATSPTGTPDRSRRRPACHRRPRHSPEQFDEGQRRREWNRAVDRL